MKSAKLVTIKGRVTEGLGKSNYFTCLTWVREQFVTKLGIDPYPGTLNLDVTAEDMGKLKEIKKQKGIEIVPAEGFCLAQCFPVLVCGKISGAMVIPRVPGYPESKLEIISSHRIRKALSLKVGDQVQLEVITLTSEC